MPPDLLTADDYERLAAGFIEPATLAYIAGGSGTESTLRENRQAFERIRLRPRVVADEHASAGSTAFSLAGQEYRHPFLLAPVACQGLVHPRGELDSARGAAAMDACMVVSTLSSTTLEEIARETGAPKWFQLYFQSTRAATLDLVRRAEAAGFLALVVTIDTPVQPVSRRAQLAGFRLPDDVRAANLANLPAREQVVLRTGESAIFQGMMQDAPTRADLRWLLDATALPVFVKGVLHPEDARALVELGAAGIVVSNHGGRALDDVPASIDALPAIRHTVGPAFPLLLDSGVRNGRDAFRALALGASAVLVGRPQVYALAVAGALGVAHLLKLLREDLEMTMAMSGCRTLADIGPELLFPDTGRARS